MNIDELVVENEDKRLVSGYATVEIVDRQGDYLPIEVFTKAMIDYMSNGGIVLYGHTNKPVGKVIQWNVEKESESGVDAVKIVVEIYKDSKLADDVWAAIKNKTLTGFSIGGINVVEPEIVKKDGRDVRVLKGIELNEISIVGVPANQGAVITAVSMAKGKYFDVDEYIAGIIKEKYPWDKCIRDNIKRYGSKEIAEKVCGSIKAKYGKSLEGWGVKIDEIFLNDVKKMGYSEDVARELLNDVDVINEIVNAEIERFIKMKDIKSVGGNDNMVEKEEGKVEDEEEQGRKRKGKEGEEEMPEEKQDVNDAGVVDDKAEVESVSMETINKLVEAIAKLTEKIDKFMDIVGSIEEEETTKANYEGKPAKEEIEAAKPKPTRNLNGQGIAVTTQSNRNPPLEAKKSVKSGISKEVIAAGTDTNELGGSEEDEIIKGILEGKVKAWTLPWKVKGKYFGGGGE